MCVCVCLFNGPWPVKDWRRSSPPPPSSCILYSEIPSNRTFLKLKVEEIPRNCLHNHQVWWRNRIKTNTYQTKTQENDVWLCVRVCVCNEWVNDKKWESLYKRWKRLNRMDQQWWACGHDWFQGRRSNWQLCYSCTWQNKDEQQQQLKSSNTHTQKRCVGEKRAAESISC